jgi:hypothetical protein
MAYATTPDAPRVQPAPVRLAVILLYVVAALEIINVIASVLSYSAFKSAYEKTYAGTSQAGGAAAQATFSVIFPIVIGVILAAAFIVLAIFDARGSNVSRIITWIFGGLSVCCVGVSFGLNALGRSLYESAAKQNPDMPSYTTLQNNLNEALPGWYGPVMLIAGIGALVLIVLAAILLALPASNPYFRKRTEPVWQPPAY